MICFKQARVSAISFVTAWNDSCVIPLVTEMLSVVSTVVVETVRGENKEEGVWREEAPSPVVCKVESESSSL